MSRPHSSTLVSTLEACSQASAPHQLGHRIVAVFEEDPLVEFLGPPQSHGGVDAGVTSHVEGPHELVEEQPA